MNKKYRKPFIAGNWKMNMLASEVKPFMSELKANLPAERSCDVALCVPGPLVPAMVKAGRECKVSAGGQDCSQYAKGAYTGEVSALQLADLKAKYCIVGHSERRQYHAESDMLINAKAKILIENGIKPIICVGESLEQREMGLTMEHIAYQVKAALSGISSSELRKCVIAYEPIWAIGKECSRIARAARYRRRTHRRRFLKAGRFFGNSEGNRTVINRTIIIERKNI